MALRSISRCPLGVLRLGVLRPKPPVNPRGKRFLHDDGGKAYQEIMREDVTVLIHNLASDAFDKDKLKAIVTVHHDMIKTMIKTEMKDLKHSVREQIHEGVEAMQQTLSNILFRGAILVCLLTFIFIVIANILLPGLGRLVCIRWLLPINAC